LVGIENADKLIEKKFITDDAVKAKPRVIVGRLLAAKGGGPAAPEMGGGESHGSQASGIAGLPKHLPAMPLVGSTDRR
jgi:hypothetical protein